MNVYMETPTSPRIDLEEYANEMEVAALVMAFLAEGHDWIRLHSKIHEEWITQWTVLERNEEGLPLTMAFQEFDGESGLLTGEEE